jgi:hypothetical protein
MGNEHGLADSGRSQHGHEIPDDQVRRITLAIMWTVGTAGARPSTVATMNRRASDGAIIFHERECVIGDAAMSKSAGSPVP